MALTQGITEQNEAIKFYASAAMDIDEEHLQGPEMIQIRQSRPKKPKNIGCNVRQ